MVQARPPEVEQVNGRVLGWLSGLGLAVVPWIAAGLLASIAGAIGGESWNPETTFPWVLLASFVGMLGGIAYGSLRIPGFRRGAALGAAVALAGVLVLVGLVLLLAAVTR